MSLIIKDDFLPTEILERQIEIVNNTEWYLAPTTLSVEKEKFLGYKQPLSFGKTIDFNGTWESEWYWTVNLMICARFPQLKGLPLDRVRLGLLTEKKEQIVNPPHIDFDYPTYTGLLYLNDTDGDTHFYKEKFTTIENNEKLLKEMSFTVDKKVTPKTNRFVLFDGLTFHSSCNPTKTYARYVVNFNWRKQ